MVWNHGQKLNFSHVVLFLGGGGIDFPFVSQEGATEKVSEETI